MNKADCRRASAGSGVGALLRETSAGGEKLKEEATIDCPWSRQVLTVERVSAARLPTEVGEFRIAGYRSKTSGEEFVALYKGEMNPEVPTLARIHSQCLTGDVFGSTKCDCGRQLHRAVELPPAVALGRAEHVARQALRVYAGEGRHLRVHLALVERDELLAARLRAVAGDAELADLRRQSGRRHALDRQNLPRPRAVN